MWSTGMMPVVFTFDRNRAASSSERGLYAQPRGLRENIWKTSHPASFARSTARSSEPAIETCTPTFTMDYIPSCILFLLIISTRAGYLGIVIRAGGRVQKKGDGYNSA